MKPEITREKLEMLHLDPANWYLWLFYVSREDPRVVVKRRSGMGWTLNFARPLAVPLLAGVIAFWFVSMELLLRLEISESGKWTAVFLYFVGVVALCGWLSDPRRYGKGS